MKVFTCLLISYYVLTMLFPHSNVNLSSDRIYPQVVMALLSIYMFIQALKNWRVIANVKLLSSFTPLLLLIIFYVIYPLSSPNGESVLYSNIIWILKNIIGIPFMLYIFVQLQKDEEKNIQYIYTIYIMQIIYAVYSLMIDRINYSILIGEHGFDSNAGFILISCIPMALLISNKRLRIYLVCMLVLACVFSGQRSAALAAAICIPFCISSLKSSIKTVDIVILLLAFIVIGLPVLSDSIDNLALRHEIDTESDSYGSGRSVFWAYVWEGVWDQPLLSFFGHGTCSVPYLLSQKYGMPIYSHNGFLDYLYMYGIIGLVFYIKPLFEILRHNKVYNMLVLQDKNILLILFILFITKSASSHGNWDISALPLAMTVAIAAHKIEMAKNGLDEE